MDKEHPKIAQLQAKLSLLTKRQETFAYEIRQLKGDIESLRIAFNKGDLKLEESKVQEKTPADKPAVSQLGTKDPILAATESVKIPEKYQKPPWEKEQKTKQAKEQVKQKKTPKKSNLEKYIGENIILVVGIFITVLGVAIGAKYAMDNGWISPRIRVAFGYLVGLGLLGTSAYLRKKYELYSAGLLAGAMAILYIVTYMAYTLYAMMPMLVAFFMMVLFTIFTVLSALLYNREIIAVIGLVGAYAVPMLLSDGSGRVHIMFAYMTVINLGVLALAVQKYWKKLYHSAFGITWLIFLAWMGDSYVSQFGIAMTYSSVFFVLFYLTILTYKVLKHEKYTGLDVFLLLLNTFCYFGVGLYLLVDRSNGTNGMLLFTLANAALYLISVGIVWRNSTVDRKLVGLLAGLGIFFLIIAVPMKLEGNGITLTWAGMATILFVVGRTRQFKVFEDMSFFLVWLSTIALLVNWAIFTDFFYPNQVVTPIFNTNFLNSAFVLLAFGIMNLINYQQWDKAPLNLRKKRGAHVTFWLPVFFIGLLYATFALEIWMYWDFKPGQTYDFVNDLTIWMIDYTIVFLGLLTAANVYFFKKKGLVAPNLIWNVIVLAAFLTAGLFAISEIRDEGRSHLLMRYLSFALVAGLFWISYQYIKTGLAEKQERGFEVIFHITMVWILSSELLSWMDIAGSETPYKLALSILWGLYSLLLIGLGIWQRKQFLRVGAIVLFVITLVKLFSYDLSSLSTISKTVVLVCLGVLLLIISFLYNKYKDVIAPEE